MTPELNMPIDVAFHNRLDPGAKLIWAFIRFFGQREIGEGGNGSVRIPNVDIARKLHLAPKSVERHIAQLRDLGLFSQIGVSTGRRLTAHTPDEIAKPFDPAKIDVGPPIELDAHRQHLAAVKELLIPTPENHTK